MIDRKLARRLVHAAMFALIRGAATAAGGALIAGITWWITRY